MSTVQTFDYSVNLLKVIPWLSDQSPNLRGLLDKKSEWYQSAHRDFWTNWERDVFNMLTANDFGLSVWSIILGLPLYLDLDVSPADYPAFGFANFGMNFDNGNFATGSGDSSQLTTEQKRQLLRLRWWQITSDGTMPSINNALNDVFGSDAYALDGHNMTITYIFQVVLPNSMMRLIQDFDIVPRPSGVLANYLVKPRESFGFADYGLNFDQPNSQFAS